MQAGARNVVAASHSAFRNMLVHRGRHLQAWTCIPTGQHEQLPDGRVRFGVEAQLHLPRDPSRGEVDAWRDDGQHFTLDEDARETLNGVWRSTQVLVEGAAALLLELWNRRRRAGPLGSARAAMA